MSSFTWKTPTGPGDPAGEPKGRGAGGICGKCTGQLRIFTQDSIKASVLYGSEEFVVKMLAELQGDRREQRGMREKERLGLGWPRIVEAIAKVAIV